MQTEITIQGMSCEHCVKAVKAALLRVPGVRDATVAIGSAVVTSDAPVARDALDRAVSEEGYRLGA